MKRARVWIAVALVTAVVAAGCGSDKKKGDNATGTGSTSQTTAKSGALTASFRGVTADSIKVGIVMVDYDAIKQFVDFNRGDQQKIAQVVVDDINAHGGIGGRKIVPVYKPYSPIGNAKALEVCTALTEDEKVFAAVGVFIDFSGDAQLCLARDHKTIHIGHELRQPWIDQAPPGLLITPDITAERRANVLMAVLKKEGTLKGKKVAVLGNQEVKEAVDNTIKPGLDGLGVEQGSTAILTISSPQDNPAALAQLDSFLEKWKRENVQALVLSGFAVSAKAYVDKIKAVMPSLQLLSDQPAGVVTAGQDANAAHQKPNPYEGILSAEGPSQSERWANKPPILAECVSNYEKATGTKVVGPDDLKPGPDGKRAEIYVAVSDFCGELHMLKTIAEKAGPNLTNDSWTNAVDNFGHIDLASTTIASLKKGKYDADDGFSLVKFDSSVGAQGNWKAVTPVIDVTK